MNRVKGDALRRRNSTMVAEGRGRARVSSSFAWLVMRLRRLARGVTGRRPGLYLFVAVACFYLASMSREVPWGDARPVYEVAESIVQKQKVSVPTRWPSDAPPGRAGKFYAAQPLLTSLVHIPGAALRVTLNRLHPRPELEHLLHAFAGHVAGVFLGALVAWLFFCMCLRHGASPPVARFASILLAAGTIVWVYSRYPFTEIVQIACFTGFFFEFAQLLEKPNRRSALVTGLWAGMLLNTKYIYVLCLPGALLLFVILHRKSLRPMLEGVLLAVVGLLPGMAMVMGYNYLRFDGVAKTGYPAVGAVLVENSFISLWGFLFSPGKSVFLYAPPLLLAALGLPRFWHSHRRTVLAMIVTIFPVVLFYSRFPSWPGDWAWGPRYVVFAVPVLLLPAVAFLSAVGWRGRWFAGAILTLGFCVQILGNAFYWDHFIRLALEVRTQWLGSPDRRSALTRDKGGYCEGCFEDVYPMVWLGPFQPILGHLWLIKHVPLGHDWARAGLDAPWRRHTRIKIDATAAYKRVRMDHWLYDTNAFRTQGWILLFLLVGTGSGAGVLFVRRTREPIPEVLPDGDARLC